MSNAHQEGPAHTWQFVRNFVGSVENRLAIRDLLDSYADGITRRDKDVWASCWAREGHWKPDSIVLSGVDNIVTHWVDILKSSKGIKGSHNRLFLQSPGSIVISGDEGQGWAYTSELIVDDNNMTYHLNGMYSDRYVREDGRWVFPERVFRKLHIDRPY